MDIKELKRLLEVQAVTFVTVTKSLNWRFAVHYSCTANLVYPLGHVTLTLKHPHTASELLLLRLLDDNRIPFQYEDLTAAAGFFVSTASTDTDSQQRPPCSICGKKRFKTSLNCYNPSKRSNNRWTCLLQRDAA
ncbi:hypothetical protein SAMN05660691_02439 [Rheinheimera pacifica]|uniref:Uncharacterized protein n=1 Tax=Rheinheimera pacifica TaxID=173990 RepID=A0A1H6MF25_9GAMM|nr:hypothetical protein [Rheinheimera pacifica]SEH96440.1 hypothetical protein SAMN05660691_02439 [Rheinheimera pacifica]